MARITKLCVAIPNTGDVKVHTVQCLMGSMFHTANYMQCGIHLFMPTGCYIDENRNKSVNEALEVGASHLMFIDSDMTFPDNGIVILSSRDKQVIGANYNLRDGSKRCTVKVMDAEGNMKSMAGEKLPTIPFKAYAVATGFMLINMDVFKRIDKPYFFNEYDPKVNDIVGEDVNFCKKVRGKGIDVWCDPTIEVRHIGDFPY